MCEIEDEEPTFCEVVDILDSPVSETLFIVQLLTTVCYNQHYHAYEVSPTGIITVYHDDFSDYHPLQK